MSLSGRSRGRRCRIFCLPRVHWNCRQVSFREAYTREAVRLKLHCRKGLPGQRTRRAADVSRCLSRMRDVAVRLGVVDVDGHDREAPVARDCHRLRKKKERARFGSKQERRDSASVKSIPSSNQQSKLRISVASNNAHHVELRRSSQGVNFESITSPGTYGLAIHEISARFWSKNLYRPLETSGSFRDTVSPQMKSSTSARSRTWGQLT